MPNHPIQLIPSWLNILEPEFEKPYMQQLKQFLIAEKRAGKQILPKSSLWFNALNSTPFEQVKVVILGQDPYPTPGHAHGLSFSVLPDVQPLPKSLQNMNKELQTDLNIDNQHCGYLQPWADQGVLLLNAVLTVEAGRANSHQNRGWETFTDAIIQALATQKDHLVFILWGAYAQKKDNLSHLIDTALFEAHTLRLCQLTEVFLAAVPFHKPTATSNTINWHPLTGNCLIKRLNLLGNDRKLEFQTTRLIHYDKCFRPII